VGTFETNLDTANDLFKQGKYDEALEWYLKAANIRKNVAGEHRQIP
jgi:tetratricopeptide (TPR) repeat protein